MQMIKFLAQGLNAEPQVRFEPPLPSILSQALKDFLKNVNLKKQSAEPQNEIQVRSEKFPSVTWGSHYDDSNRTCV